MSLRHDQDDVDKGEMPIYPGSLLTVGSSILLQIEFALNNGLTGKGLSELLRMIILHLPTDCILPQTTRELWKYFEDDKKTC